MRLGKTLFLPSDFKTLKNSCYGRWLRENLILLLADSKGTDQTVMMSKPVYLSVEIVTDNPTSGKISIPQLVSVAEQNGFPLPGRNPSIYVNMLVYQLCMPTDVICRLLIILTSIRNIFHVSDWVQVHVYVIISSSLKPYKISGLI